MRGWSAAAAIAAAMAVAAPALASSLIVNARIVDGTGAPARSGSVRIDGDRIVEVGELQAGKGETVVDAKGLALAPGFIDTHSHHDWGMEDSPTRRPSSARGSPPSWSARTAPPSFPSPGCGRSSRPGPWP